MNASRAARTRQANVVLRTALRDHRGAVLWGTVLLCIYQTAEASVPVLLGAIIDHAMPSSRWWAPVLAVLALGVAIATVSLSWQNAYRILQRANASEVAAVRSRLTRTVIATRDVHTELPRDEYVTVIAEDTSQASDIIEVVPLLLSAGVGVIAGAVVLAVIDPMLGGIVFGSTVVLLVVLNMLSKRVTHRTQEQQQLIASATGTVSDLLRGLRPLHGFGGRGPALRRYHALSSHTRQHAERLARITGVYEGISAGTATLLVGVVGVVAGLRAFSGAISIGELVAVVGLTQFVAEPLRTLSRTPRWVALARGSALRVVELATGQAKRGGAAVPGPTNDQTDTGAVLVPDISVALPGMASDVQVAAGAMVSFDCDVDTAAGIAAAFAAGPDVEANAPAIMVRGVALADLEAASLRQVMLADGRHPTILGDTVGAVVAPDFGHYRRPDADPRDLLERLALSDIQRGDSAAHDLLDHPVADRGTNLSGGQRQRLAVARALHADPEILVLVDPTSAVDPMTATRVVEAVREWRHGKTTIILAANRAFMRIADYGVTYGGVGKPNQT